MLILSRKAGDAILIDGGIRIVVLATDSGGVRLGIEAPPSVGIVREEIVDKIADENRRAGATPGAREMMEALGGPPRSTKAAPSPDPATDGEADSAKADDPR